MTARVLRRSSPDDPAEVTLWPPRPASSDILPLLMPTGDEKPEEESGGLPGKGGSDKGGSDLSRDTRRDSPKPARTREPAGMDVKLLRLAIAGIIGVALVVVLAVKILGGGGGDASGGGPKIEADGGPVAYSASDLESQAEDLPHAAYWVGPRDGVSDYELTVISPQPASSNVTCTKPSNDGPCIYVRYLTGGAAAGDQRAGFITVASYVLKDAQAALQMSADGEPSQSLDDEDGSMTLTGGNDDHAYVVFDDEPDIQVEVFSPNPGEADDLVSSGDVERLG